MRSVSVCTTQWGTVPPAHPRRCLWEKQVGCPDGWVLFFFPFWIFSPPVSFSAPLISSPLISFPFLSSPLISSLLLSPPLCSSLLLSSPLFSSLLLSAPL